MNKRSGRPGVGWSGSLFFFLFQNLVVHVLEIPIVQQRHQDAETVVLTRVSKWILAPFPHPGLFIAFRISLQSGVVNGPARTNQVLAAMQVPRKLIHSKLGNQVVVGCEIPDGPDKTGRRGFGARFRSEFQLPLHLIVRVHVEFRIRTIHVLLVKCERGAVRRARFSARSPEEVS